MLAPFVARYSLLEIGLLSINCALLVLVVGKRETERISCRRNATGRRPEILEETLQYIGDV